MTAQVVVLVVFVIAMLVGRFVSETQRPIKHSLLSQSRAFIKDWTALFAALSAALAIGLPVLEYALRELPVPNNLSIVPGLALIFVGYGIACVANRAIGGNWSPTIDKAQEQNLVVSGVYAVIRHPLYLSGLLIAAGTNIYFATSWAWTGALLALLIVLVRIPIEERRLVERFGQEYVAYQKRSKRILPWVF